MISTMPTVETIGQRIKRERIRLDLTQRQLADKVGVGVPHISKVESDRENPSDDLLRRLAKVFGVEADELLLVARRLPDRVAERLAADPAVALEFLRTFPSTVKKIVGLSNENARYQANLRAAENEGDDDDQADDAMRLSMVFLRLDERRRQLLLDVADELDSSSAQDWQRADLTLAAAGEDVDEIPAQPVRRNRPRPK